jgi:hypothetical protein
MFTINLKDILFLLDGKEGKLLTHYTNMKVLILPKSIVISKFLTTIIEIHKPLKTSKNNLPKLLN